MSATPVFVSIGWDGQQSSFLIPLDSLVVSDKRKEIERKTSTDKDRKKMKVNARNKTRKVKLVELVSLHTKMSHCC